MFTECSRGLWPYLKEDWNGGCPIRLSFGPLGLVWGEKEYISPDKGHIVQAFGTFPSSMAYRLTEECPGISSLDIPFASIGFQDEWIVGTSEKTLEEIDCSGMGLVKSIDLVSCIILPSGTGASLKYVRL